MVMQVKARNNGESFVCDEGFTCEVISNTAFTVRVIKASKANVINGTVTVPTKIKDSNEGKEYSVTQVRFYESGALDKSCTKVVLSEGIQELMSLYNSGNKYVTALELPSTLTNFGYLNNDNLREIIVAENSPYFKFEFEKNLETGDNIDNEAGYLMSVDGTKYYYHVPPLNYQYPNSTINIPDEVTWLQSGVYYHETKYVTKIHVGKGLQTYSADGKSTKDMVAFEVDPENTTFIADEGVLYRKTGLLECYPAGKKDEKFTVWEGCTELTEKCLQYAKMKILDLNKVKKVNYNAWRFPDYLTTVIMGDDLEYFRNSQTTTKLVNYVFKSDYDALLASGKEDSQITSADFSDMANSTNHKNFKLIDGVLASADGKTIVACPSGRFNGQDYTVPEGVQSIESYAYFYTYIKNFTTNEELKSIGTRAFQYSQLETADFGKSLTLTNITGLENCEKLVSVTVSPSVEKLAQFSGCNKLESLVIPDNSKMRTIDSNAFNGLKNLKSIVFEGSCDENFRIGENAFSGCTSLKTFVFPSTISSIGKMAFANCSSLANIEFLEPSTLKTIGESSFINSGVTEITIPSSVQKIGFEAFKNCNLLEVLHIPAATTDIDPKAFMFCNTLKRIEVDPANTRYSSIDGYLLSKDKTTLEIFPPGKANSRFTLLPPSITHIGHDAFFACNNLENVTIPNKVTSIGDCAFSLCKNLNTVTFLCDEMISPDNIPQEINHAVFDESMYSNITINVREPKLNNYQNNEFYKRFKAIKPSFLVDGKNEYIAVSEIAVDMLSLNEGNHTYVVPEKITHEGKDYYVSLIGDYACQNTPANVKEIVTFNNVEYIGAKAFKQNSNQTIKSIFFIQKEPTKQLLSTTRFKLTPADLDGDNQYKEFAENMKIYVRKSAYDKVTTDWAAYKSMVDYKITDAQITNKYSTFAREFDVDFSDCSQQILAFTGKLSEIKEGNGDYGESEYHIRMESINCDNDGDGTYVPMNTGVLLKYMDGDKTSNAYYVIGEKATNDAYQTASKYAGTNVMHGVTVDNAKIENPSTNSIYVMQGGLFRYVPSSYSTFDIPIHLAYLQLKGVSAGAKVRIVTDEDANAIQVIVPEASKAGIYNLQGVKIQTPQQGIYIQNGKKYIVR